MSSSCASLSSSRPQWLGGRLCADFRNCLLSHSTALERGGSVWSVPLSWEPFHCAVAALGLPILGFASHPAYITVNSRAMRTLTALTRLMMPAERQLRLSSGLHTHAHTYVPVCTYTCTYTCLHALKDTLQNWCAQVCKALRVMLFAVLPVTFQDSRMTCSPAFPKLPWNTMADFVHKV